MWHEFQKGTLLTALILLNVLLVGCARDSGGSKDPVDTSTGTTQATDSQAAPNPAPVQIVIDNFTYNPAEITITAGTKVTWVNHDDVPHTATSNVKPRKFDSGTLDTDDKFSYVFTAPGTYDYFCAVHKHMTARITVK
jgi:plastocyanin